MSQSNVLNDEDVTHLDTSICPVYSYQALPSESSIRLLNVERGIIEHETGFRQRQCTLSAHRLSSVSRKPRYDALSYTWDSPVKGDKYEAMYKQRRPWIISENGSHYHLELGRNLIEALLYLSEANDPISSIWIDAICINQEDLEERAAQVSRMGRIYSVCQQTIVWLGSPTAYECQISEVHRLHLLMVASFGKLYNTIPGKDLIDAPGTWTIGNLYERLGLEQLKRTLNWIGYCEFIEQSRWFTRAWVCQEVSFAPKVSFRCGLYNFDYELIVGVPSILNILGLEVSLLLDIDLFAHTKGPLTIPWRRVRSIQALRERSQDLGLSSWQKLAKTAEGVLRGHARFDFFLTCLNRLRAVDAKDDRDRIFAGLGYLNNALGASNLDLIKADYTSEVQTVYTATAVMLLERMPHLALLSAVEDRAKRQTAGLPSWVPDFTVEHYSILGMTPTYEEHPYNATCVDKHAVFRKSLVRADGRKLFLRGYMLDTISNFAPPETSRGQTQDQMTLETMVDANMELIQSWLSFLSTMVRTGVEQVYGDTSLLEILWRTILSDEVNGQKFRADDLEPSNEKFRHFLLIWMGFRRMLEYRDRQITDRNLQLDERIACGPCWPTADDVHRFQSTEATHINWSEPKISLGSSNVSLFDTRFAQDYPTLNNSLRVISEGLQGYNDRRLFATTSGYLGFGSPSLQETDEVWLLEGAKVPFILRKDGQDSYSLVNECYVHGVMFGEKWGSPFKRPKTVELCLI